jgi:hypothetical protein
LESDPLPCRVFYSHIHKFVPLVFVCKLMGLLFRVLKNKGATKSSDESQISMHTIIRKKKKERKGGKVFLLLFHNNLTD